MKGKNWIVWIVAGLLVLLLVAVSVGSALFSINAIKQIPEAVATEALAQQPKVAKPPSADEIAAKIVARLPEYECASAEQVAALKKLVNTTITGVVRVEFPECLSICPEAEAITTTLKTTLTTTPTISPTVSCLDIYFSPGETKTIQEGFVIAGDIDVWTGNAWKALYDSLEKTGLITVLTKETKVRALWGADASSCHKLDNVKAGMIAAGCSEGCNSVVVVNWP